MPMVFYEFLVSKETVVLRRWERSKQKFGFMFDISLMASFTFMPPNFPSCIAYVG